jgi:nitrile hydratase
MGGMEGFGPVVRDERVFHHEWERRAFGMTLTSAVTTTVDEFRHGIERLDPALYLTAGYYGRWLAALEVRLVERGVISSDELDRRDGTGAAARPRAAASVALGGPRPDGAAIRVVDRPPRLAVGDRVVAADIHPHGHTRLPRYVRGRAGTVRRVHPAFVFPDSNAHGRGADPQYAYSVAFAARDVWGEGDHVVHVDIFEPHLEMR